MRKAILETPFEKAGVRGRSGGSFAAIGAAAMKRVREYKYDPSKDIGEKEQTGEETMAISRARKMNPANPEYWRKGLGISKARKLGAKDIRPRKRRLTSGQKEEFETKTRVSMEASSQRIEQEEAKLQELEAETKRKWDALGEAQGEEKDSKRKAWQEARGVSDNYKKEISPDLSESEKHHIKKSRKLGAKDIKPRKKRIGDPTHPIHRWLARSRILEVYGQDGLDYYDRLIQKQGLSHNEAMGSVEEAHQRHSTSEGANQGKIFSRLFPVKQREKFKFVVKEKKESEKTPVEKDFDKIRKFQMDRRMVT
jgi:hypothetical protein